ncbi:hypothetical protein ACTXG7_11640 [Mycolicibacterium sp. Dal123E01]|uniref:hypothetical protein n=1 Tax=Mycolicibacterium sp. Dal123E01 TaxID=3457578 RepID=UPI00403EEC55
MNKMAVAASIGAVGVVGAVVCGGVASASVEGFLQEMDTPFATHSEQLAEGNSFCAALTRGRDQHLTGPAAAAIITDVNNLNVSQGRAGVYATKLMIAAVKELCPVNRDFFMTAARAYDAQAGE